MQVGQVGRVGMLVLLVAAAGTQLMAMTADLVRHEGLVHDGFITDLSLIVGVTMLEDDWDELGDDMVTQVGLAYESRDLIWPMMVHSTLSFGRASGDALTTNFATLTLGAAKPWMAAGMQLHAGGGLAVVRADMTLETPTGDLHEPEWGVGFYLHGGARKTIGNWQFGGDVRYTFAPLDKNPIFNGDKVNAGGLGAYLNIGLRF